MDLIGYTGCIVFGHDWTRWKTTPRGVKYRVCIQCGKIQKI